jgi:hypothetical protein
VIRPSVAVIVAALRSAARAMARQPSVELPAADRSGAR